MMQNKEEEAKTSVWWNMDSCPVPSGYDAGRIGECIKGALETLGYFGPVTITAFGNLNHTPEHVLRALSSTGIIVNHSSHALHTLESDLSRWKKSNKPPATIMVISDSKIEDRTFNPFSCLLNNRKYNIVRAFSNVPTSKQFSGMLTSANWLLWENILKDARDSGSANSKQACESVQMFCRLCDFSAQSVESFTTHLWGKEHLQSDLTKDVEMTNNGVDQASLNSHPRNAATIVKKQPKTLIEANKVKKTLKKRKKKLKKKMMTEEHLEYEEEE